MRNYLLKVQTIWDNIMLNRQDLLPLIDPLSVESLETLAPALSSADADEIISDMSSKKLFPRITDQEVRNQIQSRLSSIAEPILSLHTFFTDTMLLELGMKPLRCLLPDIRRPHGALKPPLHRCFQSRHERPSGPIHIPLQRSENVFHERVCAPDKVVYLGFCQLFLLCLRHFHALTGIAPKLDKGGPRPIPSSTPEAARWALADLAHRLGFKSNEIDTIRARHPDQPAVEDFVRRLRPHEQYVFAENEREELIGLICEKLPNALRSDNSTLPAFITTNIAFQPRIDHYGRPRNASYQADRPHLFVEKVLDRSEITPSRYLTSFAYKKYAIHAFFGDLSLPPSPSGQGSDNPRPEAPSEANNDTAEGADETPAPTPPGPQQSPDSDQSREDLELMQIFGDHLQMTHLKANFESFVRHHLERISSRGDHFSRSDFDVKVYVSNPRCLATFSRSETDKRDFHHAVGVLQNRGYCFYVMENSIGVGVEVPAKLWNSRNVQQYELIIAIQKTGTAAYPQAGYIGRSLAELIDALNITENS
jgi:hypothetical protein